jgi:hypothetical protein
MHKPYILDEQELSAASGGRIPIIWPVLEYLGIGGSMGPVTCPVGRTPVQAPRAPQAPFPPSHPKRPPRLGPSGRSN